MATTQGTKHGADLEGAALSKLEATLLTLKPSDLPRSVTDGVRGSRAEKELEVSLAKVRKCVLAGMSEGGGAGGRGGGEHEEDNDLLEPEEAVPLSVSPMWNSTHQYIAADGKALQPNR